ncbi:MAG: SGNH/GDSL hydrolase family protein [Magnetovibrio sp.]|nr:SGNH/GDSL hydrolase family protein [Magnetovibrio sp.]
MTADGVKWGKPKRWLKVISVNAGLLMAVAVVAELAFGSIFFGENYGLLVVDRNVSRRFDATDRYGGGETRYVRDEHGLRGQYPDPSKIDIVTMGGSTTNEILLDEGKTWSDRLAFEFARAGRPMVVANAGVDGQSTVGHLKVFELWFPKIPGFKPRYVLAFIGINDLSHLIDGKPPNKWEAMVEANKTVKQYLKNNSALYGLYRTAKGMIRARDAMLVHSTPAETFEWKALAEAPDVAAAAARIKPYLDGYEGRVRELIRRVRGLGAKPIIVTQHTGHYRMRDGRLHGRIAKKDHENVWMQRFVKRGEIDIGPYVNLMAHNSRAMRVCREEGAICVDVSEDLAFGAGDHYDLFHTTPAGSAKIARFMFERLKDRID